MGRKRVEPDPDAIPVYERAYMVAKSHTDEDGDAALGRYIGMSRQAVHSWKKNQKIPYKNICNSFAVHELAYILHGDRDAMDLYARARAMRSELDECKEQLVQKLQELDDYRARLAVLREVLRRGGESPVTLSSNMDCNPGGCATGTLINLRQRIAVPQCPPR